MTKLYFDQLFRDMWPSSDLDYGLKILIEYYIFQILEPRNVGENSIITPTLETALSSATAESLYNQI